MLVCKCALLIGCFLTPVFVTFSENFRLEDVIVLEEFEAKNSFISYVTINAQNYIIKQKKEIATKKMAVVLEALAAHIAQDLGIAHLVQIISALDCIPGKAYVDLPATLHTIVPGKAVRDQPESKYYTLSLKQRLLKNPLVGRWLTEEIIHRMTWHKQLPIIVGLDLFIGNDDRHGGNIFYDPQTDSFWAIDMDCIYRWDIAAEVCEKLKVMVEVQKKQFNKEEIEALVIVHETLVFLLDRYPAEKIILQFHIFLKQVGCKIAMIKVNRLKEMVITNEQSVRKLIDILGDIIGKG